MSLFRFVFPVALSLGLAISGRALAAGSEPPGPTGGLGKDAVPAGKAAADKAAADKAAADKAAADKAKAAPPAPDKGKLEKRSDWRDGYRVAVSFIQAGRYDDAIAALVRLEKSDSPDVLNYIGYANRRMGRMAIARTHYEGALALDPRHRGALEYYGEWHVEMGKLDGARTYLTRLASVCGTSCREYQDLADAIDLKTTR